MPDTTMRNVQAANRRIGGLERRLSEITTHVLATLKRIEDKIDVAQEASQIEVELNEKLESRVRQLEDTERNRRG